jgi:uncharacterized protein (TIGR03437 family)
MRTVLVALFLSSALLAQNRSEIVPSSEGLLNRIQASSFFFTISPVTAQCHFSADGLRNLRPGDLITGFDVRSANPGAATPAAFIAFNNFEVTLGTASGAINRMGNVFGNNFATRQLVRSGPFGVAQGSLPPSGSADPWGAFVEFDVPYVYTGGDLVVQIAHTGTGSQSLSVGVTTDPGFARSVADALFQSTRASFQPADGGPFLRLRIQPAGPYFSGKSVTNGASGRLGTLSPGAISTLYGTDLGPAALALGSLNEAGTAFNTEAGGTRVIVDGIAAPVLYSTRGQVSFIAPYAINGKSAVSVAVEYGGRRSSTFVASPAADPALFTANQSGRGQGAILNQDATINSAANPAAPGSIIVLYGTGAGQMTPGGVDGQIVGGNPLPRPLAQPTLVTIGGQNASVEYSGAAPGAVAGLWQINVRVPAGLPANNNTPLTLRIGSFGPLSGVTVAIR